MEAGRKRPSRATSRPPSDYTASATAANGAGSSDDEDYEVASTAGLVESEAIVYKRKHNGQNHCLVQVQVPSVPVPQRASTRRQPKVDFSKLEVGGCCCRHTPWLHLTCAQLVL